MSERDQEREREGHRSRTGIHSTGEGQSAERLMGGAKAQRWDLSLSFTGPQKKKDEQQAITTEETISNDAAFTSPSPLPSLPLLIQ